MGSDRLGVRYGNKLRGKTCPSCKRYLPITWFHVNNTRNDGVSADCRDCENTRNLARYHKGQQHGCFHRKENRRETYNKLILEAEKRTLEYLEGKHARNNEPRTLHANERI